MANSGNLLTYLGAGTHASRPAAPSISTSACAIYYETDTTNTFLWNGSNWTQINGSGGGGTSGPPYPVFNECWSETASGGTLTFQQTTAASGNTLLFVVSYAQSLTLTPPTSFTLLASSTSGTNVVAVYKKASAAETSISYSTSSGAGTAAYACEIAGTRTLDTHVASAGASAAALVTAPAITPGAVSDVFFFAGITDNGGPQEWNFPRLIGGAQPFSNLGLNNSTTTNGRNLGGALSQVAGAIGVPVFGPTWVINSPYSGTATATLTFTLK